MKKYFLILFLPSILFADELLSLNLLCKYEVQDFLKFPDKETNVNKYKSESIISINGSRLHFDDDIYLYERNYKVDKWFKYSSKEILIVDDYDVSPDSDLVNWNTQTKINRITGSFNYSLRASYKDGSSSYVSKKGSCEKIDKKF